MREGLRLGSKAVSSSTSSKSCRYVHADHVLGRKCISWTPSTHTSKYRTLRAQTIIRALSAAQFTDSPTLQTAPSSQSEAVEFDVACTICQQTAFKLKSFSNRRAQQRLFCPRCSRSYTATEVYTDLTLEAVPGTQFQERYWGGTEIFRSPLVSFIYERGWRQNFAGFGFPGAEEETKIALDYLRPAWGEVIMDLSCGSGLFSRRFIKSGLFQGVIVSDFSENMLKQSSQFINEDPAIDPSKYTLVRMDAGRLPFETGSLAAIHAGAALHCWPNPTMAVAEISRVLKPGGVFVASTILTPSAGIGSIVGDDRIKGLKQVGLFKKVDGLSGPHWNWFEEQQLREICTSTGLVDFKCKRRNWFIVFSATIGEL